MSIRGRLLLLVLIAAVPVFLLDVWSEVAERQQLRARLRGEALQLAGHAAAEQDLRFENARYLLATLAESDLISGEDSDNCSAFLEGLADKFPIYVDIGAAYPNGTIICSSEPTSRGSNVADREYFQRVLRTTAFTVGVVQRGTVSDRKIIGMAYPVTVANGEIRAVFLLSLDLPRVSRDLAVPQAPGGNVTITVFDANGAVLARQPGGEEWIGRKPPAGSFVEVIQRESRGAVEAEGLDGVERIIGFAPLIEARGLHVAVGIPTAALFADAEAAFRRKMMLLAAVFVAAAVLAYLGGQATIRRPLAKLTKAVERLGTGDLQARSQIDSSVPEFALLGWRFDGMADHLERREKDLRQANEDL
ncbi:MAG TPA: cache domain-containing protein, partial [Alphaproteobacteria bacterium]|nr:cache domain-containing protein [Alphaproteobacteria bacterium]